MLYQTIGPCPFCSCHPYIYIEIFTRTDKFTMFFSLHFYLLFPLKIQQTANYKNFSYTWKIKCKSTPQPKTEPLHNLRLVVPRQQINLKRAFFWASFWSNCTVSEMGKGGMALLTLQDSNNMKKETKKTNKTNQHKNK